MEALDEDDFTASGSSRNVTAASMCSTRRDTSSRARTSVDEAHCARNFVAATRSTRPRSLALSSTKNAFGASAGVDDGSPQRTSPRSHDSRTTAVSGSGASASLNARSASLRSRATDLSFNFCAVSENCLQALNLKRARRAIFRFREQIDRHLILLSTRRRRQSGANEKRYRCRGVRSRHAPHGI